MPKGIYTRTQKTKDILSKARKRFFANGGVPPRGTLGMKQSAEWIAKRERKMSVIRKTQEYRDKSVVKNKGENSPAYKKDRSTLAKKQERNDYAYQDWRKQVWTRDGFKCKIANRDCEGRIEAHHILSWREHPELRYEVKNGITLCKHHHPRKHKEEVMLSPYFQELVLKTN